MVGKLHRVHSWVKQEPLWSQDLVAYESKLDRPEVDEPNVPILFLPSKDGVFRPVVMRKMGFRRG